jgi:hypothetical protein
MTLPFSRAGYACHSSTGGGQLHLMGPRAEPRETDHRSRSRDTAAFVGREREMEALLTGLEDTTSGRGRLFILGGGTRDR